MLSIYLNRSTDKRRVILAGLAIAAAVTTFNIPTADAQVSSGRNPWCLRDSVAAGGGGSWDCSYRTFEQCNASGRNGAEGSCVQNPNYQGGRQGNRGQGNRGQGGNTYWNDGTQQGTWGWGGGGRW